MDLSSVKGLGPATIRALKQHGIRDAETLALVDVRRKRIKGVTEDQLRSLRRGAQRAIYHSAAKRVKQLVRQTKQSVRTEAHRVERAVRDATFAVLLAAKTAQERAVQATAAAQERATVLARLAADRARHAAKSAEKEYGRILRNLKRVPKSRRPVLQRYAKKAEFAKEAANTARERAAAAAKRAQHAMRSGQHSLAERIRGTNGRHHARHARR